MGSADPVLRSSLALILNNPFYAGIIRIERRAKRSRESTSH